MNGDINLKQPNQLEGVIQHKVISTTDSAFYCSEMDKFINSGWQVVASQSTVSWSEKKESYQRSYDATLVKRGVC